MYRELLVLQEVLLVYSGKAAMAWVLHRLFPPPVDRRAVPALMQNASAGILVQRALHIELKEF